MHGHHRKPMPAIATVMRMIRTHYTWLFRRVSAVSCCRIRVGDGDVSTARRTGRFQREDWTALDVDTVALPEASAEAIQRVHASGCASRQRCDL